MVSSHSVSEAAGREPCRERERERERGAGLHADLEAGESASVTFRAFEEHYKYFQWPHKPSKTSHGFP